MLSGCLADAKPMLRENSIVENSCSKDKVMDFYLNNINSTITNYEAETLEDYKNDLAEELIIYAMEKAVEKKQRNLAYVKGIMNSWIKKGITTLQEAKEEKPIRVPEEKQGNRYSIYEDVDFNKFYANMEE